MNTKFSKIIKIIIPPVFIMAILFIAFFTGEKKTAQENKNIKIGVSIYKTNDTFISDMIMSFENAAKEYEKDTGIKVNLDISSAKENQRLQNDQIKRYISLNYDVLCVNLVDRTNASVIIDAAMEKEIPIVFFNREPVYEDIFRGDNIYYVGSDAYQTAYLQGEIMLDELKKNPGVDKNEDGKIQYIMLEGEMGHQDALIRTEWSVQMLIDNGVEMELLESAVANWERSQATALMEQWAETYGNKIEAVFCNNDDMALGAADALEKAGYFGVPILGIDATAVGVEAVEKGRILGTVDCNCKLHGQIIFELAAELALTGNVPEDIEFEEERYVKVKLTKFVK